MNALTTTLYTGTITMADPLLVEAREIGEHVHAYVLRDEDATNPRDPRYNSPFGRMVSFSTRTIQPDADDQIATQIAQAYTHFGRDGELLERYLRAFHDAAVVEWGTDSSHSPVVGYATHTDVDAENMTVLDCTALMCAELQAYNEWANGEVYGVIVNDTRNGEERSVWGVYDDGINDTIRELVTELERTPL